MKKHLLIALTMLSAGLLAQAGSIQLRWIDNNNALISPNEILYMTTGANHTTHFDVDVTNTSSSQHAYNVKRYDMILNQDALAYFCSGGSCYGPESFVSPNPIALNGGQSASQVSGMNVILTADLQEGPVVGLSKIIYTIFDAANVSDSVQFTVYYNLADVGIKENKLTFSSVALFPNPAKEAASLQALSSKASAAGLSICNAIGEIVYKKEVQLSEGKNNIDLQLEQLSPGIYSVKLKNAESSFSRKLIVQ